ncbi:MAG: NADH-quinone oxidoreductase subunit C [Planctomycetota bacterium]
MSAAPQASRIAALLDGHAKAVTRADEIPTFEVPHDNLRDVCVRLKSEGGFEQNTFITATDELPAQPRFKLRYQFLSFAHNERVRLEVDVQGLDPRVPSIADVYPGAAYAERETYDFFGIQFDGHEDLKRLHMPDGYGHFPLRKDFPHRGIEPDRLYKEWEQRHAGGNTYKPDAGAR